MFRNLSKFFQTCPKLFKFLQFFSNFCIFSTLFQIFSSLSKFVETWPNLLKLVKIYSKLSRFVQNYPNLFNVSELFQLFQFWKTFCKIIFLSCLVFLVLSILVFFSFFMSIVFLHFLPAQTFETGFFSLVNLWEGILHNINFKRSPFSCEYQFLSLFCMKKLETVTQPWFCQEKVKIKLGIVTNHTFSDFKVTMK